jgi:hypothetical protein
MNRVADWGKNKRLAWIVSLVSANMVFGFAHSYQGITASLTRASWELCWDCSISALAAIDPFPSSPTA